MMTTDGGGSGENAVGGLVQGLTSVTANRETTTTVTHQQAAGFFIQIVAFRLAVVGGEKVNIVTSG